MSPLVWDLGHIAAFEDLWVCREAGLEPLRPDLAAVYDADETPRADRGELPYLRRPDALDYMAAVRERTAAALPRVSAVHRGDARSSTSTSTTRRCSRRSSSRRRACTSPSARRRRRARRRAARSRLRQGRRRSGTTATASPTTTSARGTSVELPAFRIDQAPVTNAAYAEFIADGGYARRELWRPEGWAFREREGWERPLYWTADGGVRRFDRTRRARAGASGDARLLVRGRRLRALARRPAADRVRVGACGGARRGRARQPRPARLRPRPGRTVHRRLLGVDGERVRRLPGLRAVPLPRVLRGLLRLAACASCAGVLGHAPARGPPDVPQLGPPAAATDLFRLPLRRGRS